MTNSKIRKDLVLFFFCLLSSLTNGASSELESIPIIFPSGIDGQHIWVGILAENGSDQSIRWSYVDTLPFSVEFSRNKIPFKMVVLKRDAVPIVESLSPDLIPDGISVEFSKGSSVTGKIVTGKAGLPISEGLVSVQFDETLDIPLPEGNPVFTWDLDEHGAFEIRGLPLGEHTVSVRAQGYMPSEQQVIVEFVGQTQELQFTLSKAEYIHGHIIDYKYRSRVKGSFEVSVSPAESQTTEIKTEFDNNRYFTLGPFAEGASIKLDAKTEDELRSRTIEVSVPTEKLTIYVHRWIRVKGTVQAEDTGEPISEFTFVTGRRQDEKTSIFDVNGQFNVEICDEFRIVSIHAPGYSFWASEEIEFERNDDDEVNLGVIELEKVYVVRGLVVDQETQMPIQGARVFRNDIIEHSRRTTYIAIWNSGEVQTTTNADGEFNLTGIPSKGSQISVSAHEYLGQSQTVMDVNLPIKFELVPPVSVSGQVVSLTGEPVAAMVDLLGYSGKRTEDGNFHFNVTAGTWRFQALADSGSSNVLEVTVESGQEVEDVRLVIENVGRVYGTLKGLLENETARLSVKGVFGSTVHNVSNGNFELTGLSSSGSYLVSCNTNFGRELTETVYIDESLEGNINLNLTGGSSLSGRVVAGADGLAGYEIQAQPDSSLQPVVRTRSQRDGSYRLRGLVDGRYRIEIPSRDFTQQIVVQGDTQVDLPLSANRLWGKVRSAGPVEGAEVLLKRHTNDQETIFWTEVTRDGSYRINNVPSGTYTVQVTHPGYREVTQEVDVEYERVELNLHLEEVNRDLTD
ncbi:MAG: DUF2012 domain-containing protein [Gammaproteobacteria bacterium]|nr:DUF2012 domain-containing protein [Gammaproteobacteria bacterium]